MTVATDVDGFLKIDAICCMITKPEEGDTHGKQVDRTADLERRITRVGMALLSSFVAEVTAITPGVTDKT